MSAVRPPPRPHRDAPRRDPRPRRRVVRPSATASAGSSSAPTAAARRRCCASPRCTTTRRRARSTCSASGSGAPTCASCAGASATPRRRSPTSCARRSRVLDVVRTARFAALEPWWHRYTAADDERAPRLPRADGRRPLRRAAARDAVVGRAPARAARPHADERPGGRAARRAVGPPRPRRARAARRTPSTTSPPTRRRRRRSSSPTTSTTSRRRTTHVLLLRDGRVLRSGPIDDVLDADGAERVLRPRADARTPAGRPLQRVGSALTSSRSASLPRRISSSRTRCSTPIPHSLPV